MAYLHEGTAVICMSFRPQEWLYPVASTDVYTSQDYVDIMDTKIALSLRRADLVTGGTLHLGAEHRSVYELARSRSLKVNLGVRREVGVGLCEDVKRCQAFKELFDLNCCPAAVNLERPRRRY